jgi:3-oxoacyl-[acyl-carrier-protein] synthase II
LKFYINILYIVDVKRRVVITGLGVVAANGIGKNQFWEAIREGKSGVSVIKDFDTSKLDTKIAAQVINFDPLNYMPRLTERKVDRFVHFGLAAAGMAVEDSFLNLDKEDKNRIGVSIGSVFGGVLFHEEQIINGFQKGFNRVNLMSIPKVSTNSVSSNISLFFNVTGPNMAVSTGCASGTNALGNAFRIIQNNDADIMLSGGVEAAITPITFSAFCNLQLLSKRNDSPEKACRPFDKDRDGFVLGEGGAVLILEELSRALQRNARIYAEILGYGFNCGAYHMVAPEPEGRESAKAMQAAIQDAGIRLKEIDYVSAYGNSTQPYDKAETKALKIVFKDHAYNIATSGIKSMIGHTVGASGAIEAASCMLAIENKLIPPTINYETPDPDCDLDYVPNKARKARLINVLLNSSGVGNNNACIVFRKFNDFRQ